MSSKGLLKKVLKEISKLDNAKSKDAQEDLNEFEKSLSDIHMIQFPDVPNNIDDAAEQEINTFMTGRFDRGMISAGDKSGLQTYDLKRYIDVVDHSSGGGDLTSDETLDETSVPESSHVQTFRDLYG